MPWRGLEGDRDVFAVTLETGDYVGLVWYSFRLEAWTAAGRSWGPSSSRCTTGRRRCPPGSERASPIRSSDRFRRTRVPDPTGTVGGRSVHTGLGGGAGQPSL